MTPGAIVVVDWCDALPASGEPNKARPGVVVGRSDVYGENFAYLMVVPLTSQPKLAVIGATLEMPPTEANACLKTSYALAWNVQTVPAARVRATSARVTDAELETLRDQVARLVER